MCFVQLEPPKQPNALKVSKRVITEWFDFLEAIDPLLDMDKAFQVYPGVFPFNEQKCGT